MITGSLIQSPPVPPFTTAYALVRKLEGGYANNPNDPGGSTNFGITQTTYDRFRADHGLSSADVRTIQEPEILSVYQSYWDEDDCSQISDFSPKLAISHFDITFNAGFQRVGYDPAEILQDLCGVTVDGNVGPQTLAALKDVVTRWGELDVIRVHALLKQSYYYRISEASPKLQEFLPGWLSRAKYVYATLSSA